MAFWHSWRIFHYITIFGDIFSFSNRQFQLFNFRCPFHGNQGATNKLEEMEQNRRDKHDTLASKLWRIKRNNCN